MKTLAVSGPKRSASAAAVEGILKECALFEGVDTERLAELAPHCAVRATYRGQTLMEEGADTSELLHIVSGRVSVRVESISPYMEITLTRLGAGELLGEGILLGEETRYATIVSEETGAVLAIPSENVSRLCDHYPAFGRAVMANAGRILAARLRRTNQRLVNFISRSKFGVHDS